jgi:hypothetical protein
MGRKGVVDVEVDLGLLRRAAARDCFDSDRGKPEARLERIEKLAGVERKLWGAGIWAGWGGRGEFLASGSVLGLTRVREKKGKTRGNGRTRVGLYRGYRAVEGGERAGVQPGLRSMTSPTCSFGLAWRPLGIGGLDVAG